MFKKRSAINDAAIILKAQLIAAKEEATDVQRNILASGKKWQSTYVLGYITGLMSMCYQNKGIDGEIPGADVLKVARKAHGDNLATILGGLVVRMDTDKAKREYEHGQNAAVVDKLDNTPSMLKQYLLGYFDFDADGNIENKKVIS